MKQFILSNPPDQTGMIRLSGKDYHYLVRVRRFKAGAVFMALLPDGEEVRVQVRSTDDDCLVGECLSFQEKSYLPPLPPLLLFQGLPKISKMDLIVRQAVEGGITEIVPFVSEYSVPGAGDTRIDRWVRIIKEARQQSGSPINTTLRGLCTVDQLMRYWESLKLRYARKVGIFLHQVPLERGSFHRYLTDTPDLVALAVGPEGGFSPGEATQFLSAGFKPLVLGMTILRTETAALYAAAAARIILLENESWMPKSR